MVEGAGMTGKMSSTAAAIFLASLTSHIVNVPICMVLPAHHEHSLFGPLMWMDSVWTTVIAALLVVPQLYVLVTWVLHVTMYCSEWATAGHAVAQKYDCGLEDLMSLLCFNLIICLIARGYPVIVVTAFYFLKLHPSCWRDSLVSVR